MNYRTFLGIAFLIFLGTSCQKIDNSIQGSYQFISEYSATITVGGVVGITDRTFKAGEVFDGTDAGGENITIRIAEHTALNEDCPNSWCYQELLEVPRTVLHRVE